jgi:ankyrin repeat protein
MTLSEMVTTYKLSPTDTAALEDGGYTEKSFEIFEAVAYLVRKGRTEAFRRIIDNGYDVNSAEAKDFGSSLLHITIRYDQMEMFRYLLDRNADIDYIDLVGWTPLMECIIDDRPAYAKILIERGADLNIANKRGVTAPMLAQKFGKSEISRLMG